MAYMHPVSTSPFPPPLESRTEIMSPTCSSPMRDRSHTMMRRSAPHEPRMVSFLGFHPICSVWGFQHKAGGQDMLHKQPVRFMCFSCCRQLH